MKLLLSLLMLVVSTGALAAERAPLFAERQRYARELVQLPLASGELTVLQRSPTITARKGNALLFADIGSDPEKSPRIRALRLALNDSGWHSWAVIPPPAPSRPAQVSPAGPGTAPAPAVNPEKVDEWLPGNSANDALAELRTALAAQLARVREELPKQGFQIIIAEGMSGPLLAEVLAAGDVPSVDALIVMGPYLPLSSMNGAVGDTLAATQSPLLDLVMVEDHPLAIAGAPQRAIAARLNYLPHYRQRQLLVNAAADSSTLVTEVNAFLRYLGW